MQFNFTYEPNVSLEQRIGFEMAALIWSSFLTDDVTVNLRIGVTDELGENGQAVGGAVPIFHETQYGVYQNYLEQDAKSDEDHSVLVALQEGNTVDFLVDDDDDDSDEDDSELVDGNTEMMLTRAQAKALGMEEALMLDNGTTWERDVLQNSNSLDGYIIINDSYNWNYDFARETEAPEDTLDFLTMALHEIGHSLGFVSGLDGLLETFELHSGETRSEGFTALDLMRFSETSATIENPDGSVSDLSFGGAAYFSLDGGATIAAEFEEGHEYQASHWQRFRNAIGIMDPTLGYQERTDISHLDLQAFDVLGWDVNYAALQQGLDLQVLQEQAQQAVAADFGVDIEAIETALTSGQDWQTLGYKAWFHAFQTQVLEQGWGTWFQGFESQIIEQGWGTWFQDFEAQMLEQGWGTWFQDFEAQMLEQGWGTWFQDFEAQMLEQGWGTWFQAFEGQLLRQLWGTWFQTFEAEMLEQLWGTWFQDFEAQVLEQGWGTWFQNYEAQVLEQGWGGWFLEFEGQILNQSWGTWFQNFDLQILDQSWGTWFQNFDAQVLEQGWGTWFQNFEAQVLEQGWGTWFQDFETQLLEQGWGTWFQSIDIQLLEQGWGTWFQKFEEQVLEQGWGTWWQQIEQHSATLEAATQNSGPTAASSTLVSGGTADDILAGSVGKDLINGDAGDDLIDGKEGDDIILGDAGNDIAYGWQGEDVIFGGDGDDVLAGENDNDQVYGEGGHDILSGGRGEDYLEGGEGRDVLKGDTGNDVLDGGADDDQLNGGSGEDLLIGGFGKDTVDGGRGDDVLYGDRYFIKTPSPDTNTAVNTESATDEPTIDSVPSAENPLAALDFWIRLEAEDMQLKNYSKDQQADASGGSVIATRGKSGKAKTTFNGPSGTYDLVVGYFAESHGHSEITLEIERRGPDEKYTWQLNGDTGASTHKISGVELKSGDRIEIKSDRDGGGLARLDYIDVLTAGTVPHFDTEGNPADNFYHVVGANRDREKATRFEAESMELKGGYTHLTDQHASGDAVIADTGRGTGTATMTYTGQSGVYNLYANYIDSSGGKARAKVLLNGETLHSWQLDLDDDATHERTLGLDVVLHQGDVIEIQGDANRDDQAVIDYLVLEQASAAEENTAKAGVMRVEAEQMTLEGKFKFKDEDSASGEVIVENSDKKDILTARTTFTGETGLYDIIIGYYDLEKGDAEYRVTLAGEEVDSWKATLDLAKDFDEAATTRTLEGILINTGDSFSLQSLQDDKDKGYIDYVEFVSVDYEAPAAFQLEVERMDLAGKAKVKTENFAHGDGYVEAEEQNTGIKGTALFTGETGYYDVVVGYYDGNKGTAEIAVKVDNKEVDRWYADQNLGVDKAEAQNFIKRTVAQGIKIDNLDVIEIDAIRDEDDRGNLDYIQFIKVDPPALPEPASTSNVTVRVEAEDMALAGNYLFENQDFASGSLLIKTGSSLTATTEFDGPAGTYDIIIGYYDENDGQSPVTVELGGTQLDSWTFDQSLGNSLAGTNNFVTRTVAEDVTLDEGAVLKLEASNDAAEWARIDYIEFVAVETPKDLQSGSNSDVLRGGAGNDTAYGGEGDDVLYGNSGDDILYGDFEATSGTSTVVFESSFEGVATTGFVAAPWDGWFSSDGLIEVWASQSAEGNTHIELNRDAIGYYQDTHQIFREIDTIVGQQYALTFQYAPRNGYDSSVNALEVRLDGKTLRAIAEDGTGDTSLNWKTYTVTFEGNGSAQTLEFISTGQALAYGRGAQLDDIKLVTDSVSSNLGGEIYNGSRYVVTDSAMTWEETQAYAETLGGNLVTINDAAENQWLKNTFGTTEALWIGLSDVATEGTWEWASGEVDGWILGESNIGIYSDWAPGKPDNYLGQQDYAVLSSIWSWTSDGWDDVDTDARFRGIIEIDLASESGNDSLTGGTGHDTLWGGAGNDSLIGTDEDAKGLFEQDTLTGGSGADQFVLGNAKYAYYSANGDSDYALITDFTNGLDQLQLHGSLTNYQQSSQGDTVFLYYGSNRDLVAKFENLTHLNLASSATFV